MGAAGGLGADGKCFIPAAVAGSEMDAVLCAGYDGVTIVKDGAHAYLPADWLRREYPRSASLALKIEVAVRDYFV